MNAYFLSMKPEERENILSQHREVYNGYQTLNPAAMESTQPLYTQDFANDKLGMVVNNKGEVKQYTNMGINESRRDFSPLGYARRVMNGEMSVEDAMQESELSFVTLANLIKKLKGLASDMKEEEMCEQCSEEIDEITADDMDVSSVEPAYQFQSHGPEDVYGTMKDYDKEHPHHDYDSMEDVMDYDFSDDLKNMFPDLADGMAFGDEPTDTFQHDAGDVDREGDEGLGMDTENDMDLSDVDSGYNFMSYGSDDPYNESEDIEEEVDEDLKESFREKRKLVMEMMNRMSKF